MNEYDDLLGGANEYDAQLQVDGEREAKKSTVRTTLFGAVQTNPDQYAEAKRVGAAVGVPADIAVRNLDTVRQRAQLNEYDKLVETSPKLADKLTDPAFAKLAHDDTPQLGTIERLANSFKRGLTGTLRGGDAQVITESAEILSMLDRAERGLPPDASTARYGSLIAGAAGTPENIRALRMAQQQRLAENALDFARRTGTLNALPPDPGQEKLRQMGDSYGFLEGTLPQFLFGGDAIGTTVNTVAESLSALAPSLPLIAGSGAAGGARALATATGLSSFGTEYVNDLAGILTELKVDLNDEAAVRAAIASPEFAKRNQQALVKSGVIGVVDALTAGVGGARLASGAAANMAAQTGVQATGGAAGEVLGSVASGQEVDPTAVLLEAIGEIPTATVDAAALAVNRIRERRAQATDAEQNAEVTSELLTQAASNKLRERDPEAFQQFMQSVAEDGPVPEFYVDAQALAEAAQGAGVDLAAVLPSVGEQLQAALASGGDVRIPAGEFFARLPGSGLEQSVLPLVKTDPEGMTQAQAQEFRAGEAAVFEQEIGQVTAEQAAEKQRRDEQAAIEDGIYEQLQAVGRFSPSVNRSYATLTAQFYDTLAQRTGISAAELAQRYPITVRGEGLGSPTLDQGLQYPLAPAGERYTETDQPLRMMTPDEFLARARPLEIDEASRDNIDDIKLMIQSGRKLDPLHLYADGKEDGRHRAIAAKELGIQQVPVADFANRLDQLAYHGTPHLFDEFKTSQIGTGEGAQAFGYGLYFAENKGVAEGYQQKLSDYSTSAKRVLDRNNGDVSSALADVQRSIDNYKRMIAEGGGGDMRRAQSFLSITEGQKSALERIRDGLPPDTGNLYTVDIPDDVVARMLDWDKPLSEQPASVQEALASAKAIPIDEDNFTAEMAIGSQIGYERFDRTTGEALYTTLGDRLKRLGLGGDREVSQFLDSIGIPGIRYLDAGSRADGDGSRNLVVFNDRNVRVVDRNGQPVNRLEQSTVAATAEPNGKTNPITRKPEFVIRDADGNTLETLSVATTADEAVTIYNRREQLRAERTANPQPPVYFIEDREKVKTGSQTNWRIVKGQDFSQTDAPDEYLYHVTSAPSARSIIRDGLVPGNGQMFGGAYASYSTGKAFLTERNGVEFWRQRVEANLSHNSDNPPAVTVVRIPKSAISATLVPDAVGTKDAGAPAYYVEGQTLRQNTNAPRGTISFTDDITQGVTISLLENADLSTYNHELAHFFLEVMNDIANQPNAPAGIVEDMDKVLEWFGITATEGAGGEQGGTLEQSKQIEPLVALHNLSAENLLFADKLGGLPVPSIGITKAATPYRGFGEITLIGRRDLATPSLNNPVFAGDAYTQRFPDVVWPKVSMKKAQALIDSLGDTRELRDTGMLWDRMVNTPNRDEAIREAQQSATFMRSWLLEQGETPVDPVLESRPTPRGAAWAGQKPWLDAIKALKADGINPYDIRDTSPEWSRLSDAARKAADAYIEQNSNGNERAAEVLRQITDESFDDSGNLTFGSGDRAIGFASSADRPARPDIYATRRALQNQIGDRSEQFGQWAAKKVSEQFGEPSITVKGRKVPLTLENVVEAMASARVRGREKTMTFGGGQVAAANAKQFRTLEELQAERDRIVSPEAERDAKKTADQVLEEYRTIVLTSYTGTDYRGQIDTWAGLDASMKALADLAKKAPTLSNLRAALARNGFKDVPTEGLEAGVKALTAVRQTVTDYFEAKPQRAVMLSEFAGALIPDNAPAAVREILERASVAIREYASGSDRDTAVGEFASELNAERNDVLFQNGENPEPFGPLPQGRTRREVWNAMSLEQRRQYHEQFARGFEAYLMEGKAPSKAMREIFRRFAAWMKRVYKQMTALRVNLSDEVRGVYDRLLATDDAIRAEQRARSMAPLIEDGDPVGDSRLEGEATDEATERLAKRSLRDMQWLANARSAAMRRLQKQGAEQRKEVRREVEAEVRAMPVYAVQRFLKRGEVTAPDGADVQVTVGNKLAIDQVQRMFGEDTAWRGLGFGKYGMLTKSDGLAPDVVAEMFGFPTGEVMVRQILAAAPEREMIEGMTDQRMLERYGDVSSPDALSRAANEELSNDAHIRFLATELAGLRGITGKATDLAAAARMAATRSVGTGKVKDVRPRQYIAAEGRTARKAEAALASGDRQQAARHKREQLLTVALARESYRAQEEIDKALRGFERVFAGKDADVAKRRNLDLVKAARAVLGRYGLGPPSDKSVQYLAYVEKYDPGLYAVLKPVIDGALQGQDYRDLSVDDFRAVRDAVMSLWTQSKRAKQVEIDGAMMDREQVAGELVAQVEQLGGKRYLSENRTSTEGDRTGMILLGMRAALRRVESFVDSLDQGNPTGPWRRYVWQPISDAAARYRLAKLDKLKAYRAALDTIAPTLTYEKIAAPELGGFVFEGGKQEVLHAMLHSGNQSNLNKLVAGYRWGEIGEDGNVDARRWWAFLERMSAEGKITKADWDFVQTVWDLLESTKADTQAAFRDMYGMYFAEVTAQPVQTPFGTYRGGYVPAKTDPAKVPEAQKNEESVLKDGNDMYAFPSTGNGFTKSRVESYTKELQLDLRQIASHLDWVLRFTYLQPRVLDVYRTINDRGVRSALGEVAPRAVEEMLTPWLSRTALQMAEKPFQGTGGRGAQRALNYLRRTSSMQLMALNVVNALQNFANVPVLALKVPPARIASALLTVTRSPKKTAATIAEKSEFMRTRLDSQVMDIQRSIADTVLNPSPTERVREWAAQHGHFLSLATQNAMDLIAWTAAYDAAAARGIPDQQAVREADSVVRQTQGSLAPEDISAFEASNAFVRVFTMFYSFFNTQANLLGTEFTKTVREQGLRAGAGRALWVYTFGLLLPAVLGELIAQSLRGQLDLDGEDDDEPLLGSIAFTLESQAKYATAMVPGVGQLAVATMNAFNSKPYDDRIGSSPAVGALEAAVRVPKDVYEVIAEGKEIGRRDVKDVLTLVGLMTGTPAAVLARPIGYQIDVDRGSTTPDGPLDYTRGLITGTAPR